MTTDELVPERVPVDGLPEYTRAVLRHFHEGEGEDDVAPFLRAYDRDYRAWWVRDQGRVVANLGVIETDISLPGGVRVPVAAITAVGVSQTRRRRGLLRKLMDDALDEAVARGEPLAALYASESAIYGRFGFEIAAEHHAYRAERARVRFRDPVDVRLVSETTPEDARRTWPAIHDRLREERGGSVGSTPGMWLLALVEDPPGWRDGATARRLVEVPGRGYASYRIKGGDGGPHPADIVQLAELVATDAEAESALWQHVLDIDLTATVRTWIRPVDDALPHLIDDPLALHRSDGPPLYLRLLDLPAVLTARTYAASGRVVLEVVDPDGRAGGRWRLEADAGAGAGECRQTSEPAELTLGVDAAAAVVLGGVPATSLARARRVDEERDGAAATLDRLLAVERAPWTTMMF